MQPTSRVLVVAIASLVVACSPAGEWSPGRPASADVLAAAQERASPPAGDLAEFRAALQDLSAWLDEVNAGAPGYAPLGPQVERLDAADMARLRGWYANPRAFVASIRDLLAAAPRGGAASASAPPGGSGPDALALASYPTPVLPEYPTGTDYSNYLATLPGLGGIADSDGDGSLNDEHTDQNYYARIEIAWHAAVMAKEIAIASVTDLTAAWTITAAVVAVGVEHGLSIPRAQCNYQDGLVNSAEIRAAYQNAALAVTQLGNVQYTLDNEVERRQVHLGVVELVEKRVFLVSATESGRPVADVEFLSVKLSDGRGEAFHDVTPHALVRMVDPGVYHVAIRLDADTEAARIFSFEVRHANDLEPHFGYVLFDRQR